MENKTTTVLCHGGGDDPDPFLHLPEDFLIQILVRLPIQSLLRFKSVCKSWRALIQTSFFIYLHANYSSSSSNFGSFILRTDNISIENRIFMLSEYEGSEYGSVSEYGDWYRCTDGSWLTTSGGGDDQLLLKVDTLLELPSWYSNKLNSQVNIAGSCNGLICLHDFPLRNVYLWNPATGQFRILPKSVNIEIDDDDFIQYGPDFVAFGFDVKTKDYKVLLITNFKNTVSIKKRTQWPPKNYFCRGQVYSLSTDSWRLLEDTNFSLARQVECHGLYLNGSCFFITNVYHPESNTNNRFINSFDFTKEIFTTMQLPDHDHRHNLCLRCFGGGGGGEKMALFTTIRKMSSGEYPKYHSDDNDGYGYEDCDIWVLNEHGSCGGDGGVNKESWTKLHSFQIKNSRGGQPIGISNNGKFAFLETWELNYSRNIQLYNLVTKKVKLDIPLEVMSNVYVYKQSLVSIIGGN